MPKPGPMEAWDAPPTVQGYKGGDLMGIAERLDDLADLGVTALYLTPVFASASNHRYHTDDYYQVDPLLGGNEALRQLLDDAHARDMRVVLDGVFNHCGRGFWRFHHVAETGAASPFRPWFHLDEERLAAGRPLSVYPNADQEAEIRWLADTGMGAGEASRHVLGFEGWWATGAAQVERREPPDPGISAGCRGALAAVRHRWLASGRRRGDLGRLLVGIPAAVSGGSPGCLSGR